MSEKYIDTMLDAFMALRDVPDEAIEGMIKSPVSESLTEGKSFDIYNFGDISEAKDFFENEVDAPETEIKVIDADVNALRHLKDKDSYIGQAILRCNRCKANLFMDMSELKPDDNDPELYNVETECPHCHSAEAGFEIVGQVGKVEKEEEKAEETSAEEISTEEAEETNEEAPEEATEEETTSETTEFSAIEEPSEEESEESITFDNSDLEQEPTEENSEEESIEINFDELEAEEEPNPMETSESEEEIEKEVITKDGKKLKLKMKKLGDVYEESFEEDEDEVKESLVEEVTPEYIENTNGKDAWMMGQVIQYMNDETAYFDSGWLYLWPDGESEEECYDDFGDQEDYEALKNKFERVYRRFHSGGLYDAPADVEAYAHEVDKRLGLKPIDNLQKVIDFNSYEPLHESETIDEFLKKINHPERIDKVIIAKKDYDVFDDSKLPMFEGMCDDLEPRIKSCNVKCFDVGDGFLTCNIDSTKHEAPQNLKSFLDKYDNDKSEKVVLWDLDTCDQCYQGPKKDAIDRFGDCEFYCVEAPKILVIKLDDEEVTKKELPEIKVPIKSEEDKFVDKVYQVNHLNPYAKNDPNSDEYWISEGIKNKENLKTIFEKYIKPLDDKDLIETFKNLTNYKEAKFSLKKPKITESVEDLDIEDEWVEIPNYETLVEFGQGTKWGVAQADAEGKKYFDDYSAQGKLFARVIDGKRQLKFTPDDSNDVVIFDEDMKEIKESLTEAIQLDNDQLAYAVNTGWKQAFRDLGETASIQDFENYFDSSALADTTYDQNLLKRLLKNKLIKTKIYGDKVVEDFEADDEIEDVEVNESKQPSFKSFKTRKELSEAITECKNNTQPYTIRRSVVEGYRYDLILNESDFSLRYNSDDYKTDDLDARADKYEEERSELIDITDDDADYIDDNSDEVELKFDDEVYQTGKEKLTETAKDKPEKEEDKKEAEDKIVRSISEAAEDDEFDLEVIDDDNDAIEIVDAEVVNEPEQRSDDTRISNLSRVEIETVEKIGRISQDIVNAVKDTYNIDIDPELVAADILQDLRLISHDIRPDQLRRTASNIATIDMFHSFEETMDVIDQLMSMFTGQTIESTPERRLSQAIRMLDSDAFSTEAICDGIASDRFLAAVESGAVPYITADELPQLEEALLDSPVNLNIDLHNFGGSGNDVDVAKNGSNNSSIASKTPATTEGLVNLPVNINVDAHEFGGNNNDVDVMSSDKKIGEKINDNEIEFPSEKFDSEITEYFTEAYCMNIIYATKNGYVDKKGNILLEGVISTPDSEDKNDLDVKFTLRPLIQLTEDINNKNGFEEILSKSTYRVTNNLSEEIFEFSID